MIGINETLVAVTSEPLRFLRERPKPHLWFLPALVCAISISAAVLALSTQWVLLACGLFLYVIGLAGGSSSSTPIGLDMGQFNTRNGPFFGSIFFVTGYMLSTRQRGTRWLAIGAMLFVVGLTIPFSEVIALWKFYRVYPNWHDYLAGTYLLGLGAAMVALSGHRSVSIAWIGSLGSLSLGIYAIHFVFIDNLAPLLAWLRSAVGGISSTR